MHEGKQNGQQTKKFKIHFRISGLKLQNQNSTSLESIFLSLLYHNDIIFHTLCTKRLDNDRYNYKAKFALYYKILIILFSLHIMFLSLC